MTTTPGLELEPAERARTPSRWRGLMAPVGVGVAAAALLTCLAIRDPNDAGSYPLCPFRAITGWDCPGCGALRGLHALAGGDVRTMADQNVLLVMAVPFLLWRYVAWSRRRALGLPAREPGSMVLVVVTAVIVVVFWVVRNLPGVPFLGSGIG